MELGAGDGEGGVGEGTLCTTPPPFGGERDGLVFGGGGEADVVVVGVGAGGEDGGVLWDELGGGLEVLFAGGDCVFDGG